MKKVHSDLPGHSAFSLVELSIVLVILGLLVGGILAGQSLIRASELRSVTSQFSAYSAATMTFRDKYFSLPGDMTNAVALWGAADGTTGNTVACLTTAGSGTTTCNGDGDGIIKITTTSQEQFRFWQHLSNAGMIEGSYDGITHNATGTPATYGYATTAANSPSGKLSSTLWFASNFGVWTGKTYAFDGNYGNVLTFGTQMSNYDPTNPAFTPAELWNMDTKLDDGMPATGKLVQRGTLANCTDSSVSSNMAANYLVSATSMQCSAIFRNLF